MSLAFIFPGQGSQSIGMGKALADAFAPARQVFEEIDEALGERLSRLMWQGEEAELTLTANAQPALMAVSLAAMRTLELEFGVKATVAQCVAGHSLGEYSALAAAGAFTVADAARLLRRRGEAMQAAVAPGEGAMASLIGKVDVALAEEIAAEGAKIGVCVVANDNNVGNVVISGSKEGVAAAIDAAKTRGVRAILLNVSAPFHSPLMGPAADAMAAALEDVEIATPLVPVIANVTTAPTASPAEIRRLLVAQVTGRVRWRESVIAMAESGVGRFAEVGAGKVLTGMVKRNAPDAEALALNEPEQIESFAKSL
jgi:[acyl-carrier-protein] S-malonyltransferase